MLSRTVLDILPGGTGALAFHPESRVAGHLHEDAFALQPRGGYFIAFQPGRSAVRSRPMTALKGTPVPLPSGRCPVMMSRS